MQVEVTFLTRKGPDAIMRKSRTITAEAIGIGRGTNNEVELADIRVELAAAALHQRDGSLFIEQRGDSPLRVNGSPTVGTTVVSGDEINIGPYKLLMTDPGEGFDAAFTVELVQPMGDALQKLTSDSRIGLDKTNLSKRSVSWALFVVIAAIGLVAPIFAYHMGNVVTSSRSVPSSTMLSYVNLSWNSGELSNPHRFFAENCTTCHRSSFSSVPDEACASCHTDVANHLPANTSADFASIKAHLEGTRCADCHEEHRGLTGMVVRSAGLCVDCHGSLPANHSTDELRSVTGFPTGHPQFRATLVQDAAKPSFTRVELGTKAKIEDHPNLHFSHKAHLVEEGFLTPAGKKVMVCADCHVPEPSGQGFLPITFEGQCHSCHDLKFDAALPSREVAHGDAKAVKATLQEFYSRVALQGGLTEPDAPALSRRLPGTPLPPPTEAQQKEVLAWVANKSQVALGLIFDDKQGCTYCHVVTRTNDDLDVAPVLMEARFLPNARFDHAKHAATPCADCHDSKHSDSSGDVMIPGIEDCASCHGGESAALKTQSTCTSCHVFHRTELGPMRKAVPGGERAADAGAMP
jgi:hypothetical protein